MHKDKQLEGILSEIIKKQIADGTCEYIDVPGQITDDDFESVCRSVEFKTDADRKGLKRALISIKHDFKCMPRDEPTYGKVRDMLCKIKALSEKQEAEFQKLYGYKDIDPVTGEILDELEIPDWYFPIFKSIDYTKGSLNVIIEDELTPLPSNADQSFGNIVCRLANIFVRYTDHPITTNHNFGSMEATPKFQYFAEQCYQAIHRGVPDSFELKLHRTVIELRKAGRIPKN